MWSNFDHVRRIPNNSFARAWSAATEAWSAAFSAPFARAECGASNQKVAAKGSKEDGELGGDVRTLEYMSRDIVIVSPKLPSGDEAAQRTGSGCVHSIILCKCACLAAL